jgi:hypothetical protein
MSDHAKVVEDAKSLVAAINTLRGFGIGIPQEFARLGQFAESLLEAVEHFDRWNTENCSDEQSVKNAQEDRDKVEAKLEEEQELRRIYQEKLYKAKDWLRKLCDVEYIYRESTLLLALEDLRVPDPYGKL